MSRFTIITWLAILGLGGCTTANAPSIYMFGSYFPSWLFSAVVGIVGAIVVHELFSRLGLNDVLPFRLLVYVCVALIIGIGTSLLFFVT